MGHLMHRMRRTLIAVGTAVALSPAIGPAGAQTPPGVLVVGQIAEPKALDPAAVTAVNDFRILMNVYDGLVRYRDGTLEVEPALATDWEISEDGTEYTFTLREGVTFHDGSAFDAEAVKFNFDRMLDEEHPFHDTGPFPLAFFFSAIELVEVVDPLTVRFTLTEPYAPFLSNLAYPTGLIVSPAAVEQNGADFGRNPSGTGPFRFVEWRSNEAVVVEKNPDYWDGAPPLEAVVFRPITDANTRTAEMLAGGIDLMVEVPPVALSEFQGGGYTIHEQAGPHVWFLILNTREGPFADVRVRQRGEPRHQQGGAGQRRAGGHRRGRRRADSSGLRLGLQRGTGALPLRPRGRAPTARRSRSRGRGADVLRHRRRIGDARPGGHGHGDPGGPRGGGLRTSASRPTSGTPSSAR